jgi:hypothetical protein
MGMNGWNIKALPMEYPSPHLVFWRQGWHEFFQSKYSEPANKQNRSASPVLAIMKDFTL